MKYFFRYFILIFLMATTQAANCAEPITIGYIDRIPYQYISKDGLLKGVVAEPVIAAFKKTGIPYQLKQLPAKRILVYLKENRPQFCSIGWYKNPEREKFAIFSIPVYQNKSRIAIARHDNHLIPSNKTLAEILKIPGINLLTKDGYSYGKFIDDQIARHNPKTITTSMENDQMLMMVIRGNNNYFFMSEEEADALIPITGHNRSDFKYIHFSDIPVGLKRYILYSKQVDKSIVDKIDQALKQIVRF